MADDRQRQRQRRALDPGARHRSRHGRAVDWLSGGKAVCERVHNPRRREVREAGWLLSFNLPALAGDDTRNALTRGTLPVRTFSTLQGRLASLAADLAA